MRRDRIIAQDCVFRLQKIDRAEHGQADAYRNEDGEKRNKARLRGGYSDEQDGANKRHRVDDEAGCERQKQDAHWSSISDPRITGNDRLEELDYFIAPPRDRLMTAASR